MYRLGVYQSAKTPRGQHGRGEEPQVLSRDKRMKVLTVRTGQTVCLGDRDLLVAVENGGTRPRVLLVDRSLGIRHALAADRPTPIGQATVKLLSTRRLRRVKIGVSQPDHLRAFVRKTTSATEDPHVPPHP